MKVNAAFIFVAPEVDYKKHRTVINTPTVNLTVVGVKTILKPKLLRGNYQNME